MSTFTQNTLYAQSHQLMTFWQSSLPGSFTAEPKSPVRLNPQAPVFKPRQHSQSRADVENQGVDNRGVDMIVPSVESTPAPQSMQPHMFSLIAHSIHQPISLFLPPNPSRELRAQAIKERKAALAALTPQERATLRAGKRAQKRLEKEMKMQKDMEGFARVFTAAEATVAALRQHGISCATFGSLACRLYGNFRTPKDADILIIQPPNNPFQSAEEVKSLVVNTDSHHFYLKLPRDPKAPYRILYYRPESGEDDCKVDILIPGTMYLPNLSHPSVRQQITTILGIPLVPFPLLLLHKLQGWADHRAALEQHKRRRHIQDASDVRRLMAMGMYIKELRRTRPWNDSDLFCEDFQDLTRLRVKEYCAKFPRRSDGWQMLGFETS